MAVMNVDIQNVWRRVGLSLVGLLTFAMCFCGLKAPSGHVVRPLGHGRHQFIEPSQTEQKVAQYKNAPAVAKHCNRGGVPDFAIFLAGFLMFSV